MTLLGSRVPALAGLCLVVALVAGGCGVRVGTPPAPVPTPDAAEAQRQALAVATEEVARAATEAGAQDPALLELAQTASIYLDALGGVWLPPPREEDPTPRSPADPTDLATALEGAATHALRALEGAEDGARPALISMWLTYRAASAVLGGEHPTGCAAPCAEGLLPPDLAEARADGDLLDLREAIARETPGLITVYDALGYAEEVRAARAPAAEQREIAAGARELRAFADWLVGEDGAAPDPRRATYPVTADLEGARANYLARALGLWLTHAAAGEEVAREALWLTYAAAHPDLPLGPWPGMGESG